MAFDFNIKKTLLDGVQSLATEAETMADEIVSLPKAVESLASQATDYFNENLPNTDLIKAAEPTPNFGSSGVLCRPQANKSQPEAKISDHLGPLNTDLTVGDKTIAVGASSIKPLGNDLFLVVNALDSKVIDKSGKVLASLTTPFGAGVTHDTINNCVVMQLISTSPLTVVNIANHGVKTIDSPVLDPIELKFTGLIIAGPEQWFIKTKNSQGQVGLYDGIAQSSRDIAGEISDQSNASPSQIISNFQTYEDGRILFRAVFSMYSYDHGQIVWLPLESKFTSTGYIHQFKRPTISKESLEAYRKQYEDLFASHQAYCKQQESEDEMILKPLWHEAMNDQHNWQHYDRTKQRMKRDRYDSNQREAKVGERLHRMFMVLEKMQATFEYEKDHGGPLVTEYYDRDGNLEQ